MARVAGLELLSVAHRHLDRRERKIHQRALTAEVAADGREVHADLLLGQPERVGEQLLESERHLVRRPHLDAPVGIHRHHAGVRLEIPVVSELRPERVLEDEIGFRESLLDISEAEPEHGLHVRMRPLGRSAFIRAGIGVHERSARLDRGDGIEDRGPIFILDVDHRERFFREIGIDRRDDRHFLADESHAVTGQERHVEHPSSHQHVGKIARGEHCENAGTRLRLRRVDPADARVGQRTPERLAPDEPGQRDVGRISRPPADLVDAVNPADRVPNDAMCRHTSSCLMRELLGNIGRGPRQAPAD